MPCTESVVHDPFVAYTWARLGGVSSKALEGALLPAKAGISTGIRGRLPLRRARAGVPCAVGIDVERPRGALDHFLGDHHLLDPLEARQVEHGVEQDALHDRAQAPRPGLAIDRLSGD